LSLWIEERLNRKLIKFLPDYHICKLLTFNTAREEEVFGRNHLSLLLLRETYTALLLFYAVVVQIKKISKIVCSVFFLSIIEVVIKRATNAAT